MSETLERSEALHHAGHAHASGDPWALTVGIMVAILAAALALAQIGAKSSQTHYLTDHVALSNNWAFYQAKNERAVTRESEAAILASLPNAQDPAIQQRITAATDYAKRMRDDAASGEGMAQLQERSRTLERSRDAAFERYHAYELASGALEIAIVLASASLISRVRALTLGAGAVGLAAIIFSVGVATGVM